MGFKSELFHYEYANEDELVDTDYDVGFDLVFTRVDSKDINGRRTLAPLRGLQRLSAFDNLLHGRNSFASQVNELVKCKAEPGVTETDFLNDLLLDEKCLNAGEELYRMLKDDKIYAQLSDGSSILMHHYRYNEDFIPIQYFANVHQTSKEFLMAPNFWPGQTLKSEMTKLGVKDVLGPQTVQLLEDLGYATKKNPKVLELEMIDL